MKLVKTLGLGAIALTAAGIVSAQSNPFAGTVVNVVGSTAFRGAVISAETAQLSHVGAFLPGGVALATFQGAGPVGKAGISIVYGYDANGNEVMFRNHWTGSAAGTYDLANGTLISQLPTTSTLPGSGLASGTDTDVTQPATISFTDVQGADAAAALSTAIGGGTFAATISGAGLVDAGTTANHAKGVAVATFQWVLGKSAIAPANWAANPTASGALPFNLTQQNAASLIASGSISLADVTGVAADANTYLALVGRNEDSGSRIIGQAESLGGGTQGNANAFGAATSQFMLEQDAIAYPTGPSNSTGAYPTINVGTTITGFKLWPRLQALPSGTGWTVSTIPALTWKTIGHSGYNGGGDVANILSTNNPVTISGNFATGGHTGIPASATAVYFVSYLGSSDANTVIGNGGVSLPYNGVPYSVNSIEEGQYTLWTFEHQYYTPALAGTAKTVADGLADTLAGFSTATLGNGAPGIAVGDLLNGLGRGQVAGARVP